MGLNLKTHLLMTPSSRDRCSPLSRAEVTIMGTLATKPSKTSETFLYMVWQAVPLRADTGNRNPHTPPHFLLPAALGDGCHRPHHRGEEIKLRRR